MPNNQNNIKIHVNTNTGDSHFSPKDSYVVTGGKVTLQSTANSPINVCTYQGGSLKTVFTSGGPPYAATPGDGTQYTLLPTISGKIVIQTSSTSTCPSTPDDGGERGHGKRDGKNGTINVGE